MKTIYQVNEPLRFDIIVENISEQEYYLDYNLYPNRLVLDIYNEAGTRIGLPDDNIAVVFARSNKKEDFVKLYPGHFYRAYDITGDIIMVADAGKYTVRAYYQSGSSFSWGRAIGLNVYKGKVVAEPLVFDVVTS